MKTSSKEPYMAGENWTLPQEQVDLVGKGGGLAEAWIGSNIQQQVLLSPYRWTVSQGMEDLTTTSSSTRRSKKRKREANALTREILNKILWLKLHRRQKQGYLCPTYHCKT